MDKKNTRYEGHDEGGRKPANVSGRYDSPATHEDLDKTPSRVCDEIQKAGQ